MPMHSQMSRDVFAAHDRTPVTRVCVKETRGLPGVDRTRTAVTAVFRNAAVVPVSLRLISAAVIQTKLKPWGKELTQELRFRVLQ